MKKILIINTTFNKGGAAIVANTLFKGLQKDFDIYFAYGRGKRVFSEKTFYFGNFFEKYIHIFLVRFLGIEGYGTYFQTKKLIDFIKKNKFEIVNIHNIHGYYLNYSYLFSFLKRNNIKIIYTAHDEWVTTWMPALAMNCSHCVTGVGKCENEYVYPKTYNKFFVNFSLKRKKNLVSQIDIIITPALWLKEKIKNKYNNLIENIYNGIDTKIFYPREDRINLRKKHNLPIDKKIVVFAVANLEDKNKNIQTILDTAKELPDIVFLGIGNGKIEGSNILPTGYIQDRAMIAEIYSASDLFVYTSKAETMPLVLIEAILSGLSTITLDTPFYTEIANIGNCIISKNKNDFKNNIIQFFEGSVANNDLSRFKEVFSYKKFLESYKNIFNSNI